MNKQVSYKLFLVLALFVITISTAVADGSVEFRKALQAKDVDKLSQLIELGENINMQLENGRSALMVAARYGHTEFLEQLLDANADVDLTNENGGTALMFSAIDGNVEATRLLIDAGASVNKTAKFGWTAIMVAAAKGRAGVIDELLINDADPNARDIYQWTPLIRASFAGHGDAVQELLKHPEVEINAVDENGATALHHAATNGHLSVVEVLVEQGAMTNMLDSFAFNPAERALMQNHQDVFEFLANLPKNKIKF